MNQEPKIIKFSEIEDRLRQQLQKKASLLKLDEPVTLFDGFVNQPVGSKISTSFVIGGPTMPMVMLIGNETGRIYFFALKAILHDLGI